MRMALLCIMCVLAGCSEAPQAQPVDDGAALADTWHEKDIEVDWTAEVTAYRTVVLRSQDAALGSACYRIALPAELWILSGTATATWSGPAAAERFFVTLFTFDIHPLNETSSGSPATLEFESADGMRRGMRLGIDAGAAPSVAVDQPVQVHLVLRVGGYADIPDELVAEPYGVCPR